MDVVFLCRYTSGTAGPRDAAEVADVEWVTIPKVLSRDDLRTRKKGSVPLAEVRLE